MTCTLNAVAAALDVHPRTILRLTTGEPNPYWAEGFDPDVDLAMVAVCVQGTEESLQALLTKNDSALTVEEAASALKIRAAAFYRMNLPPDWQVGRVKRYSLRRIGAQIAQ